MTQSRTPMPPPLPPVGISTRPARLRWVMDDLLSRDGHRMTVGFSCTAVAVDEPAERQLFTEAFSASPKAGSQAAVEHFVPSLRIAAAELAGKDTAEELLGIPARSRWVAALRAAANETGFSSGIETLAPFEVEVTSPTLQRERLEQMQRIAAERRSADRAGHLARAAELLKQWETLKTTVPSITPGKLLEQVNPADRGLMLDTLLMASAGGHGEKAQQNLWAVSGSSLVRLNLATESANEMSSPELIAMPPTAGPLRSVRFVNGKLFIGTRNGVVVADSTSLKAAVVYLHGTLSSEFGFTSAVPIGNRIWACHREGGLVGWDVNKPAEPVITQTVQKLGGDPRQITPSGLFALGTKVMRITASGEFETSYSAETPIVALLTVDQQVMVISESGQITTLDQASLEKVSQANTAGPLTGAALLPWLSTSRLLLSRGDGPIECIGLEDQLVTRFAGNQAGMRAVNANAGRVAAMSNDRQRVLIWNAWDGRKPVAEIYVTGITHHRIADLTIG